MTDLLERYLAAVARELPAAQAPDVIAELRDSLLSEIEERQDGLGRALDRGELEALLVDFGHPLIVAGRYRKIQHLIGPQVFPFWFSTLKLVLLIEAAAWLGVMVLHFAIARPPFVDIISQIFPSFLSLAITTFGIVTLVFAALARTGRPPGQHGWNPARLPPARSRRRGRFELASEIVMGAVFLLWWSGLIRFGWLLPLPPAFRVELAPIWTVLHWPIVVYISVEMSINIMELANPAAVRINASLSLMKNLAGCVITGYALSAGHWLDIVSPALSPPVIAKVQHGFDQGMRIGLIASALVLAIKAGWDLWRLMQAAESRPSALANGAAGA